MSEKELKLKVLDYLKSIPNSFTMKLSDYCHSGYPDILFIWKKTPYFFELKDEKKGKIEPLQLWTLEQLHNAGAETYIIYNLKQIRKVLDKIQDERIIKE